MQHIGFAFGGACSHMRKRAAIFKHESQKDKALFPGPDPREFWERAEDRNLGTADSYIPLDQVEQIRGAVAGPQVEFHLHEGADHAFANPSGTRYAREWRKTLLAFIPFGALAFFVGWALEIPSGFAYIGATDPRQRLFNRLRKHVLNLWNSCRVLPLTRGNRYDLIQAKDNFGAALVCAIVARLRGLPFFYWIAYPRVESFIHEGKERIRRYPLFFRIQGYFLKFLLYKVILPASRHIFVQSEQMMKDIAAMGVPYTKMTPVPSSVDLDTIPYDTPRVSDKLIEKGNSKWVVYLGTLKRIRRLDFMIRSFAAVVKKQPDAKLLVIGKGDQDSDLQWLKEIAEQEEISSSVIV